jgi:hypothetical protein
MCHYHQTQRKAGDQDTAENEPLDQVEHVLDLQEEDNYPFSWKEPQTAKRALVLRKYLDLVQARNWLEKTAFPRRSSLYSRKI